MDIALLCSINGCQRPVYARTWCNTHYVRWQKYGDVAVDLRAERRGEATRFWAFVEKTDACWNWTGSKNVSGYGKFWTDDGRTVRPHRWAYEHAVGPVPEGLQLDHLCRNRGCVRPDHLEAVTGKINSSRGENGRKTHCLRGHPYDEENTYVIKPSPSLPHGGRGCRACRQEHSAKLAAKRAAKRGPAQPRPLKTHCKKGHEFTQENTYMMPNGGRGCRQCRNANTKAYLARKKQAIAIMAVHAEGDDGRCVVDGVRWPCGPWVTARETV